MIQDKIKAVVAAMTTDAPSLADPPLTITVYPHKGSPGYTDVYTSWTTDELKYLITHHWHNPSETTKEVTPHDDPPAST